MRRAICKYWRAGESSSGMDMATASSCDEIPTNPCASVSWISRASRARSSSTSAKRDPICRTRTRNPSHTSPPSSATPSTRNHAVS